MADDTPGPGKGLLYALLGALCDRSLGKSDCRGAIGDRRRPADCGARRLRRSRNGVAGCRSRGPGFAETATARRDIADLRTARGDDRRDRAEPRRDATRIATLVDTARAAIARRDYDAADRALDEAERIDAQDPAVLRTRNELLEAEARLAPRDRRN